MIRGRRRGGFLGRTAAVAFVVTIAAANLASPALAAPALTLAPTGGPVGTTVSASGTGFADGDITIWWDTSTFLESGTAVGGAFDIEFTVPAGADGPHTVRACEQTFCAVFADATFTVGPAPTPTPLPTPKPTPTPQPTKRPPTPAPTPTGEPTAAASPTPSAEPTSTPAPTGVGLPVPSFPLAGSTQPPTPLPVVAITPAPQPPGDVIAPESEFPNLYVAGIEVTQGIQNLANDMPLVADRTTYARVYIGVTGAASWPNTWGALEARRDGQQIGWIWPENGPITARASGGDRTSLDDSLQFRLPAGWLHGTVRLTTFVFSYTIATPFTQEPDAADNTDSELVTFQEGQPLTVHMAPLHLHRSYHPFDVVRVYETGAAAPGGFVPVGGNNSGGLNRIISGLYRYLPLWNVDVDILTNPIYPIGHATGHEFDLGGPCKAYVTEVIAYNRLVISDWTILVKDPSEYEPGITYLSADREEIRIMDRTYHVGQFSYAEDGTAEFFGTFSGYGPEPVPGAPAYAYGCFEVTDEAGEPLDTLGLYRVFYDWADEREIFVGMIDPSLRTAFGGLANSGNDAVWVRMSDSFGGDAPWDHTGAGTLAHEAGHTGGLRHVPCKDDNGDLIPDELIGGALDLTHPTTLTWPVCALAEVDSTGYYGFDTEWDLFGLQGPTVLSNDPAKDNPNLAFPFMGYKNPGWSDPYHYCRLLTYYGVPCSASQLGLPWNPPNPEPDGSDPFAAVTPPPAPLEPGVGSMTIQYTGLEDDTWSLEVLARNSTPTTHDVEQISAERRVPPDPERPWIVVLDATGTVRWQASLPAPEMPHEAEPGPMAGYIVVPVWPDTSAVEVRGWDADVKARVERNEGVPEVAGLFKDTADGETIEPDDEIVVRFETSDRDGDRLRHILLYAPDREHWQVVGVSEEREIPVPVKDLPSGDDPAFRLVAFDGWNVGEAEVPAPELAAPRNPPTVMILAAEPRTYPGQALVRLEATAFDLEDRSLPGEAIAWQSSIDGDLGSGSELATRTLSVGRHTITATATDSDGLQGHARYELEVDGSIVETLPNSDLTAGIDRIFERLAAGLDPAPDVPGDDLGWLPFGIAGLGLGVVLLIGALSLTRLRRQPAPASGPPTSGTPPAGEPSDDATTWMRTGQLAQPGSMGPEAGGANELRMDDAAGSESPTDEP